MNEHVEVRPVVKVARDLREIETLYEALTAQAIHKASDRLMPGGEAMVALAHVGSPSQWSELIDAAEHYHLAKCDRLDHTRCRYAEHTADEDETEPPLQTLLFWSEQWRTDMGYELDRRPTMSTEASFLRNSLEWAWDNVIEWDDFAKDVRRARVRLENLLHAGDRPERSRIVCDDCEQPRRLIKLRADDDLWKCTACRKRFDEDALQRAHAKMLRSEGAEKWVQLTEAVATLVAQRRPGRTVRQWVADGEGSAYCDPVTHKVWVWWPDLWRKHLSTPTRRRAA